MYSLRTSTGVRLNKNYGWLWVTWLIPGIASVHRADDVVAGSTCKGSRFL